VAAVTGDPAGFAEDCAELGELWPQLAEALQKDTGATSGATAITASEPFNLDVMRAMVELSAQVPVTTAWAAERCGEPWRPRPVPTCLHNLPRFHERLLALQIATTAQAVEQDVRRWRRLAKLALRLIDPSWDLPSWVVCTAHEVPSTPLRHVGAERAIVWEVVQEEGKPKKKPSTVLMRDGYWLCEHCGQTWPTAQWELLVAAVKAS